MKADPSKKLGRKWVERQRAQMFVVKSFDKIIDITPFQKALQELALQQIQEIMSEERNEVKDWQGVVGSKGDGSTDFVLPEFIDLESL